jgi:hypothetical protein
VSDRDSFIGVRQVTPATTITAHVFLVPTTARASASAVGIAGFDENWAWHDDGFEHTVPTGQWVEIRGRPDWTDHYQEIGLKLDPSQVATAYLGEVRVEP